MHKRKCRTMKIEQGTSNKLYTFNEYELAQYGLEVRKPLEDEIEYLKYQIKDIEKDLEASHSAYKDLKQKVIAELEEWVHGYNWWMQDGVIYIVRKDLKQKLNEMKGGEDE